MRSRSARFAAVLLGLAAAAATPASAQTRRVDAQLSRDFPDQRRDVQRQDEVNGTRVFDIRIAGDKGESNAVITETGDYLLKSVPFRVANLPEPVTDVLGTLFREPPAAVSLLERTSYLVDLGGRRSVRLEIDAAGRLRDVCSATQVQAEEREVARYEKARWRDGDAVTRRLGEFFEHSRVKEVYQYPDAPGFYYAELTADRDSRKVQMVLDARKDVPFWRYELRPRSSLAPSSKPRSGSPRGRRSAG